MANSIRQLIEEKALKLRDVDALGPHVAASELVNLTALLASINKLCADRRYWLGLKKVALLQEHKSAAKAIIYAEGSIEFRDWLEAEEYRKAVVELMRSIKFYLKNNEIEQREAKY